MPQSRQKDLDTPGEARFIRRFNFDNRPNQKTNGTTAARKIPSASSTGGHGALDVPFNPCYITLRETTPNRFRTDLLARRPRRMDWSHHTLFSRGRAEKIRVRESADGIAFPDHPLCEQ
jgi:hypothetical protein